MSIMGPVMAGYLRQLSWSYVFLACAVIISLNFILLLTYKEVGKEERLERNKKIKFGEIKQANGIVDRGEAYSILAE